MSDKTKSKLTFKFQRFKSRRRIKTTTTVDTIRISEYFLQRFDKLDPDNPDAVTVPKGPEALEINELERQKRSAKWFESKFKNRVELLRVYEKLFTEGKGLPSPLFALVTDCPHSYLVASVQFYQTIFPSCPCPHVMTSAYSSPLPNPEAFFRGGFEGDEYQLMLFIHKDSIMCLCLSYTLVQVVTSCLYQNHMEKKLIECFMRRPWAADTGSLLMSSLYIPTLVQRNYYYIPDVDGDESVLLPADFTVKGFSYTDGYIYLSGIRPPCVNIEPYYVNIGEIQKMFGFSQLKEYRVRRVCPQTSWHGSPLLSLYMVDSVKSLHESYLTLVAILGGKPEPYFHYDFNRMKEGIQPFKIIPAMIKGYEDFLGPRPVNRVAVRIIVDPVVSSSLSLFAQTLKKIEETKHTAGASTHTIVYSDATTKGQFDSLFTGLWDVMQYSGQSIDLPIELDFAYRPDVPSGYFSDLRKYINNERNWYFSELMYYGSVDRFKLEKHTKIRLSPKFRCDGNRVYISGPSSFTVREGDFKTKPIPGSRLLPSVSLGKFHSLSSKSSNYPISEWRYMSFPCILEGKIKFSQIVKIRNRDYIDQIWKYDFYETSNYFAETSTLDFKKDVRRAVLMKDRKTYVYKWRKGFHVKETSEPAIGRFISSSERIITYAKVATGHLASFYVNPVTCQTDLGSLKLILSIKRAATEKGEVTIEGGVLRMFYDGKWRNCLKQFTGHLQSPITCSLRGRKVHYDRATKTLAITEERWDEDPIDAVPRKIFDVVNYSRPEGLMRPMDMIVKGEEPKDLMAINTKGTSVWLDHGKLVCKPSFENPKKYVFIKKGEIFEEERLEPPEGYIRDEDKTFAFNKSTTTLIMEFNYRWHKIDVRADYFSILHGVMQNQFVEDLSSNKNIEKVMGEHSSGFKNPFDVGFTIKKTKKRVVIEIKTSASYKMAHERLEDPKYQGRLGMIGTPDGLYLQDELVRVLDEIDQRQPDYTWWIRRYFKERFSSREFSSYKKSADFGGREYQAQRTILIPKFKEYPTQKPTESFEPPVFPDRGEVEFVFMSNGMELPEKKPQQKIKVSSDFRNMVLQYVPTCASWIDEWIIAE